MSEERLITAAVITTGEKSDGKELITLIEKSREAGVEVNEVIGDSAYSEKKNIEYTKENKIALISKLNPIISQGTRKKKMNLSLIKMLVYLYVRQARWLLKKQNKERRMLV